MQSSPLLRCLTWTVAALLAVSCSAQVSQKPGTTPGGHPAHESGTAHRKQQAATHRKKPAAAQPASPQPQIKIGASTAAPSRPDVPASLLDKPAQPATVKLSDGQLSVDANNSSLSQILDGLKTSTGMTVDGLSHDQRVFGIYGPGNPTEVLSSLLDDAGYNVMILGRTQKGVPRRIILTARSDAPAPPVQAGPSDQQNQPDDSGDDDSSPTPNYPFPQQHYPEPLPTPTPQNGAVKTPAQILQELQQLRQQQQQQQQTSPPR